MKNQVIRVVPLEGDKTKGHLYWANKVYPCALGESGVISPNQKVEGDGATPYGFFPIRKVYYRQDKLGTLNSKLPSHIIQKNNSWSDDIKDSTYNSIVSGPSNFNYEIMWREDNLYDVVIPLGYNDEEIKPGKGSCIFLHIAKNGLSPTKGCIAIDEKSMLEILETLMSNSFLRIYKISNPNLET